MFISHHMILLLAALAVLGAGRRHNRRHHRRSSRRWGFLNKMKLLTAIWDQAWGNTDDLDYDLERMVSNYLQILEDQNWPQCESGSAAMESDDHPQAPKAQQALYSPAAVEYLGKMYRDFEVQRARRPHKGKASKILSKRDESSSPGEMLRSDSERRKEGDLSLNPTPLEVGPVKSSLGLDANTVVEDFQQAVESGSIKIISVRPGDGVGRRCEDLARSVEEICSVIVKKIQERYHYLVVFPESFFNFLKGDAQVPLTNGDVQNIIGACKTLLDCPNVICSFCFLQQFNPQVEGSRLTWLGGAERPAILTKLPETCLSGLGYRANDPGVSIDADASPAHVVNYNLFYWTKYPLAVYHKSVYYNELSKSSEKPTGFFYEYGDWKTKIIDDKDSAELATALFGGESPLILPRICADMNIHSFCGTSQKPVGCRDAEPKLKNECDTMNTLWNQQLKKAKLVLVSARRGPGQAIQTYCEKNPNVYCVVVDSVRAFSSFHILGETWASMLWQTIELKEGVWSSLEISETKFVAQTLRDGPPGHMQIFK